MFTETKTVTKQQRIIALKNRQKNHSQILGNSIVKRTSNYQKRSKPINNQKVIVEDFSAPIWLKSLLVLQKSSSIVCFLIVSAMLILYGMTVYAPQQWTREFNQLKKLQKDERQIISTNEVVKEELVKQTHQRGNGLVNPNPSTPPIFIKETSVNPVVLNKNQGKPVIKPPEVLLPLKY
jgi:hypothetical protein